MSRIIDLRSTGSLITCQTSVSHCLFVWCHYQTTGKCALSRELQTFDQPYLNGILRLNQGRVYISTMEAADPISMGFSISTKEAADPISMRFYISTKEAADPISMGFYISSMEAADPISMGFYISTKEAADPISMGFYVSTKE